VLHPDICSAGQSPDRARGDRACLLEEIVEAVEAWCSAVKSSADIMCDGGGQCAVFVSSSTGLASLASTVINTVYQVTVHPAGNFPPSHITTGKTQVYYTCLRHASSPGSVTVKCPLPHTSHLHTPLTPLTPCTVSQQPSGPTAATPPAPEGVSAQLPVCCLPVATIPKGAKGSHRLAAAAAAAVAAAAVVSWIRGAQTISCTGCHCPVAVLQLRRGEQWRFRYVVLRSN